MPLLCFGLIKDLLQKILLLEIGENNKGQILAFKN